MALETFGIVQIGGAITTLGEAEAFITQAHAFGANADTILTNGILSIEYVGTPVPSITDGVATVTIELEVYNDGSSND